MTMKVTMRRLFDRVRGVLHLEDRPWRIALALATGVFISFTPFYGLQSVLALLVAAIFRLNKATTLAGAWLNLPWFAPLVYAAGWKVGALLVPELSGIEDLPKALLVGTTVLGFVAGVVTFVVAFGLISHRRARQPSESRDVHGREPRPMDGTQRGRETRPRSSRQGAGR
jgi:uncharacterized protein (DUF2062 family)